MGFTTGFVSYLPPILSHQTSTNRPPAGRHNSNNHPRLPHPEPPHPQPRPPSQPPTPAIPPPHQHRRAPPAFTTTDRPRSARRHVGDCERSVERGAGAGGEEVAEDGLGGGEGKDGGGRESGLEENVYGGGRGGEEGRGGGCEGERGWDEVNGATGEADRILGSEDASYCTQQTLRYLYEPFEVLRHQMAGHGRPRVDSTRRRRRWTSNALLRSGEFIAYCCSNLPVLFAEDENPTLEVAINA